MIILVILFVLAIAFLLAVKGRIGHKNLPALRGWYYAHRGLHSQGVPENSLSAFRAAKDAGYGMELDVHLMKDGNLAVIHDSSLKRTAGVDVMIEELTASELGAYRLDGTENSVPLFSQVLELIDGKVPLIVEAKSSKGNHAQLCGAICNLLETYNGPYCIESFDPRCIFWLKKHRPEVIRGQLTEDFFKSNSRLPMCVKFMMKHQLYNIFSQPDFVAYRFSDRRTLSNFLCRKIWGVQGVSWTIRNQEDFDTAVKEGWIPIFENFMP